MREHDGMCSKVLRKHDDTDCRMLRADGMCNAGLGVNMHKVTPSHLAIHLFQSIRVHLNTLSWNTRISAWCLVRKNCPMGCCGVLSAHYTWVPTHNVGHHDDDRVQTLGWWLVMRERTWEQGVRTRHIMSGDSCIMCCVLWPARVCVGVYLDIPAPWDSNIDYT